MQELYVFTQIISALTNKTKRKKFTIENPKTIELIKQYASDYQDFDIELDDDLNEKN